MENGSDVSPDPLQVWLEATGGAREAVPPGGRRTTSRRLLALTAMVTIVAVLLGGVALTERAKPGAAAAAPVTVMPSPVPTPSPVPAAAAPSPGPAGPVGPVPPASVAPASASAQSAAAVLAVRTTAGPGAYVDTAVVDGVTRHDGFSVVTVLAWVLYRTGGRWDAGRALRFGVAVADTDAASPLARPWPLPPPSAGIAPRRWTPVEDQALATAAAAALRSAGYRGVSDLELRSDAGLPGVLSAAANATAPGSRSPRRQEVWLSPDASTLLGAPAAPRPPLPMEQP